MCMKPVSGVSKSLVLHMHISPLANSSEPGETSHYEGCLLDEGCPLQRRKVSPHTLRVYRQQLHPHCQQPQDQVAQEKAKISLYPLCCRQGSLVLLRLGMDFGRQSVDKTGT